MSTTFTPSAASPVEDPASARRRFNELGLEHALRATAAQQLRVVAAAHGREGVDARRVAAIEQAIADRIDRVVSERAAAARRGAIDATPVSRDELAGRRLRTVPPDRRARASRSPDAG